MKIRSLKQNDQSGMASFLVVTVIVTLLALVSIGFSHVADREVSQALDRQLSDEAYYAAESGVNDAQAYLAAALASGNPVSTVSNCQLPNASPSNFTQNGNLDANTSSKGLIRYSCVLINTKPSQLSFTVAAGETKSFPIELDSPYQLDNLYFSWQNADSTLTTSQPLGNFNTLPQLPDLPQDTSPPLTADTTGLLRVGIYPVPNNAGSVGQDTSKLLTDNLATYFLYPNNGNGSIGSVSYSPNGTSFVKGECSNVTHPTLPDGSPSKSYCNAKVTGLPNYKYFVVSLTARYKDLSVSVEATQNLSGGDTLRLIPNVQAVIDSTGAGNDVLRRVQAIAPLQPNISYGIQSMQAVCKLFRVPVAPPTGGGQGQYGSPMLDSATPSPSNSDGTCQIPSGSGAIDGSGNP